MKMFNLPVIIISILMVFSYFTVNYLKPTEYMANLKNQESLKSIVPKQLGDWKASKIELALIKAPDVEESLNEIYSDILERHYKNKNSDDVFLSLAYGTDQSSDQNQVHRPEFCYPAQGFQITHIRDEKIKLDAERTLLVRRLLATAPGRVEPITYWIVIGDKVTLPGVSRKLIQLKYGFSGKIPDGLLFRVSSITEDVELAYQNQDDFIKALFNQLDVKQKEFVFGRAVAL
ncbi:MAG: EpsI family protein [Thiomicrorhabdus sp.]|nr:EpsI family protein [Thiomicrorhabdus sp.]